MSFLIPSATHRGAPFVGRSREIGRLTGLLDEGLRTRMPMVLVSGEAGEGRRRLLAESLARGPDAEWVHLAPGGVEADLPRWARTELIDLLDTYPAAPYPSWALQAVSRWAPRLRARASAPFRSRESLPPGREAQVLGAAVGALLRAVTGRTLLLVDAGLWPDPTSFTGRLLAAMTRSLAHPGALVVGAADPERGRELGAEGARVLALGPLRERDLHRLTEHWHPDGRPQEFAGWLFRVTAGHALFVHETVRWLEELGHVRVDDEAKRVELLSPTGRLPVPLFLRGVMDDRYRRLDRSAARLLHLLCSEDGRLEREVLRRRSRAADVEFDEALSVLRRREFLLKRTWRRPLAAASPRWRTVVEENVARYPRKGFRRRRQRDTRPGGSSPLARISVRLQDVDPRDPAGALPVLAQAWRLAHGRVGLSWSGVRGRVAVLAGELRRGQERPADALRWARRGLDEMEPAVFPRLRRQCLRLLAVISEERGDSQAADAAREKAYREAAAAGHGLAAAWLSAVTAEAALRRGDAATAFSRAGRARELDEMGLPALAARARATALSALAGHRGWSAGERAAASTAAPGETSPPPPRHPVAVWPEHASAGWGWGLDAQPGHARWREHLVAALWEDAPVPLVWPQETVPDGQRLWWLGLWEVHLWQALETGDELRAASALDRLAELHAALNLSARARATGEALRATAAVGLPRFQEIFSRWVHTADAPGDPPEQADDRVCLVLTGVPGVRSPSSLWPQSLWPQWWTRLWSEALARDDAEPPLFRAEVEALLTRAPDAPEESLESTLLRGNELVRGARHITGGLYLEHDHVVMNWSGLTSDLRRFHELAAAGRAWDALQTLGGRYLSGVSGDAVARARRRFREQVARTLTLAVEGPPPDAWVRLAVLDRLGWMPEVRELLTKA